MSEQKDTNEAACGGSALTARLGYWTDFECPKCGSYMFGSARNDDGTWTRHCHGNEQWKCDFTAPDTDDSKNFKTFVPNALAHGREPHRGEASPGATGSAAD